MVIRTYRLVIRFLLPTRWTAGRSTFLSLLRMIVGRSVRGGALRPLYDLLYSADWGEITTNDYGFAPAQIEGPECYQLQMYEELYKLFSAQCDSSELQGLLEVSSGRGGGLRYLVKRWEGQVHAVGLDLSARAVEFCGRHYAGVGAMAFAQGSALSLPFKDGSFDVVVNVEASHGYGDDEGFFREVWRVLRSGGAFLYADSRMQKHVARSMQLSTRSVSRATSGTSPATWRAHANSTANAGAH